MAIPCDLGYRRAVPEEKPRRPRLRPMTVRFDQTAYELVAAEALASGVPIAQFVREAALIRAMVRALAVEHDFEIDRDFARHWAQLSEDVAALARVEPPNNHGES